MPTLRSSNIASADYDPDTQTLTIMFKSGGTYTYADVDEGVYTGLLAAPSPGRYFADRIKDVFTYTKG
jgi:hypothetical protein